jgi:hypothetical protein
MTGVTPVYPTPAWLERTHAVHWPHEPCLLFLPVYLQCPIQPLMHPLLVSGRTPAMQAALTAAPQAMTAAVSVSAPIFLKQLRKARDPSSCDLPGTR